MILGLLISSCVITEQECDECIEFARFANTCDEYFQTEYNISFNCFTDIELNTDQVCTSEDVTMETCEEIGTYQFNDYELESALTTTCESFWDYYSSCRKLEKTRKKALNFEDQRALYDGEENAQGNYCRRWMGDDEEDWELEELEEQRDCAAYAEYVFGGL